MISFNDKKLNINGNEYTLDYTIYDACEFDDRVIVLFHPDEGIKMPDQFANLVSFTLNGQKEWTANLPTSSNADVYYKITSKTPLIVNSMQSYKCKIDLSTGKILKADFYK